MKRNDYKKLETNTFIFISKQIVNIRALLFTQLIRTTKYNSVALNFFNSLGLIYGWAYTEISFTFKNTQMKNTSEQRKGKLFFHQGQNGKLLWPTARSA